MRSDSGSTSLGLVCRTWEDVNMHTGISTSISKQDSCFDILALLIFMINSKYANGERNRIDALYGSVVC